MDSGQTRQRMRPWLESKVESGQIPGLAWIDREKKIFRVPWKHGGKHDWNEADSTIFKEWAIHTGRFREGVDHADWPTWKTRFRCALNKLPDIQEMKDHNQLDGSDPYRAYKFLSKEELTEMKSNNKEYREVCTLNKASSPKEITSSDVIVLSEVKPVSEMPNFPSDLEDLMLEPIKSDPNLAPMIQSELIPTPADNIKEEQGDEDMKDLCEEYTQMTTRGPTLPALISPQTTPFLQDPPDHEMEIILRYCQQQVCNYGVCSPYGCRLFYDPERNDQFVDGAIKQELFGPDLFEQLQFPTCETSNPGQREHTSQLLMALDRGLLLECHEGVIYATRKSRCVIFISSPCINNGEPFKLERNTKTAVYDFLQYFETALQQYLTGAAKKPLAHFLVGFGQKLTSNNIDLSGLLISAQVFHSRAKHRLNQVACTSPLSSSIKISLPDDYDRLLHFVKDRCHGQMET